MFSIWTVTLGLLSVAGVPHPETAPGMQERILGYRPSSRSDTLRWQAACREKLFELMMGGARPRPSPLEARVIRRVEPPRAGYILEEITLKTLEDREAHLWLAVPRGVSGKRPAVLAIHGHGGTGEQIVRGQGLYWYGKALAEMGYVVAAPDVGSHTLQLASWSLMGERVWDCLRVLDYLTTRPEVDPRRLAVCGLSLGGETAMYVAALDTRVRAVCSSGWLTTVANMRDGHCTCYDFPGLAKHFDFADIFGCIAPRPLVCEIGEKERAPGGFPVPVARAAFEDLLRVYAAFQATSNATLTIHPGGHVFVGYDFWPVLRRTIGQPASFGLTARDRRSLAGRADLYERAMVRVAGVLEGWWQTRDAVTGLLPRRVDERVWAPNDNAADMMPFLFAADHFGQLGYRRELDRMLAEEAARTNRVGPLPDWWSLETRSWVHAQPDIRRLIFCAAEYCKDGLMPMTEAMGEGPWSRRMVELINAIMEAAPVSSRFGPLPADDTEVNGDLLQVLGRLLAMTGDQRYLDFLVRIADAYCLEVLPATDGIPPHRWDFSKHAPISGHFSLNDHGNEILLGLAEAYIAVQRFRPERAEAYRPELSRMFRRLLKECRNADGLWYGVVSPTTGAPVDRNTPDTWGYGLCAVLAFADATGDRAMRSEVERALAALDRPRYAHWSGADSYADSIEGALLLRNRIPAASVDRWLEIVTPIFFAHQQDSGIVEGWYGDGNFARTCLMLALYASRGARCVPWKPGVGCGAVPTERGVRVLVRANASWQGKLVFDTPRHREIVRLESDYPRLNQWPEWFVAEADARYRLRLNGGRARTVAGRELIEGLPLTISEGGFVEVEVERTP